MKATALSLRLVIPIQGRWATVSEHNCTPASLWSHYLRCCEGGDDQEVLAAAILITSEGEPWNGTRHGESFFHIGSWLQAGAHLLEGGTAANIWAWEESGLRVTRNGSTVVLEDASHHPSMVLPPVCFDLWEFARALALAAQPALRILAELPALAEAQFPGEWQRCQRDSEACREVESDLSLRDFRQWETAMLASLDSPLPLGSFLWRMWQRWRRPPAGPGSARPDAQAAHQRADLLEFLCNDDMRRLCEEGKRLGRGLSKAQAEGS